MQEAYEKACEAAMCFEGFVKEHPVAVGVFCTVVAIGVVVLLAPEVVEWLGFVEVGIVEGEWVLEILLLWLFFLLLWLCVICLFSLPGFEGLC